MWKYFAILSAFFAASTAILAKVGLRGISGNVAVAFRTFIVLAMAWVLDFASKKGSIKTYYSINQ